MILSGFQLCFVVFLASFPCPRAEASSRESQYNGNGNLKDSNGFSNHTRCSWNCKVVNSNVPEQRRASFAQNRLIAFEYQKTVDQKCVKAVKQTSRNSSGNATEYFKILLPANNKLSSFAQAMQISTDLIRFCPLSEERIEVKAVCSLLPVGTSSVRATDSTLDTGFLSRFVVSHLADHGFEPKGSNERNTEKIYNDLHPCITSSNSTLNETDSCFTEQLESDLSYEWTGLFFALFLLAFSLYSPVLICLFSPTLVTENGLPQIVLEGASPVSFRSLVGNFFFSGSDTIGWQKARMLILRLVVLPLPFLLLATISYRGKYEVLPYDLSKPFMKISLACYTILAFYGSFTFKISQTAAEAKPCPVCVFFKPNLICNGELSPRQIWYHLRMQPLILVKCWRFFRKSLVNCFEMSLIILPQSWKMSPGWFLRAAGFLVFLSTITPALIIILLAAIILLVFVCIVVTSPTFKVFDGVANKIVLFPFKIFAIWGANRLLSNVAAVVATVTGAAFFLLPSEESLPFVTLFVLVCYYLWSSYSSFTNDYHDLSLKLFKCYQKTQHDQISDRRANTDPAQTAESPPSPEDKGNVLKIPKELFDMACEELMPIREGVCKVVLKVILILIFAFLVFLFIMRYHVDVSPGVKALVTFFTGSFPKVLAICTGGGRQEKVDAMVIEEKAPKIVQDYIKRVREQGYPRTSNTEIIRVDKTEQTIEIVTV